MAGGPLEGVRVLDSDQLSPVRSADGCWRTSALPSSRSSHPRAILLRAMGHHVAGQSLYAASILRNKSLVCLDLRTVEAQQLTRKLALQCDVVVENLSQELLKSGALDTTLSLPKSRPSF